VVHGHGPHQGEQGPLAGGVGGHSLLGHVGLHGGDQHDGAASAGAELRDGQVAGSECAVHVDRHGLVVDGGGGFVHGAVGLDAGGGDQAIESALGRDLFEGGCHGGFIGDIGLQGHDAPQARWGVRTRWDVGGSVGGRRPAGVDVEGVDGATVFGEQGGHCASDAGGAGG